MKPKNFRKTLSYLNGDMHVLNNKYIIFIFGSRQRYLKTSNSECQRFFSNIYTIHLKLFLRKVHRMLITIDMKGDLLLLQSITAPAIFKKVLPRIIDMLSFSGISSKTKSVKIVTFATTTSTSS